MAICTLANVAVRGAVTVHFFKYYVGNSDETIFSLGRAGTPEDVAALAVYLAAPASDFITGQTMRVDGGASAV